MGIYPAFSFEKNIPFAQATHGAHGTSGKPYCNGTRSRTGIFQRALGKKAETRETGTCRYSAVNAGLCQKKNDKKKAWKGWILLVYWYRPFVFQVDWLYPALAELQVTGVSGITLLGGKPASQLYECDAINIIDSSIVLMIRSNSSTDKRTPW